MVGNAVATMVWSSAPRNIASMMPITIERISAWVSGLPADFGCGFGVDPADALAGFDIIGGVSWQPRPAQARTAQPRYSLSRLYTMAKREV
jgi:hypothetical protein